MTSHPYAIEAEGLTKRFGTTQALAGIDLAVPRRHRARRPRAERRRQDDRGAHPGDAAHGRRRHRPGSPASTSSAMPRRVRQTIGLTGQYASVDEDLTGMQNLVLIGQLLDLPTRDARARAARTARMVRPGRRRRAHGQDLLRRHAAPARPGRLAGRPPVGDLPRRADHRPRPGQARGHVGRRAAPGHRRLDRAADDPVPRRGRRAGRRDHRDRPRHGSSPTTPRTGSSGSSAARRLDGPTGRPGARSTRSPRSSPS